jgi:hypothetical protein
MAELINLRQADKFLQDCWTELENIEENISRPQQGIWSDAQRGELASVTNAIILLRNSVAEIMHNNRDGRGAAPGEVNSMLDRIR